MCKGKLIGKKAAYEALGSCLAGFVREQAMLSYVTPWLRPLFWLWQCMCRSPVTLWLQNRFASGLAQHITTAMNHPPPGEGDGERRALPHLVLVRLLEPLFVAVRAVRSPCSAVQGTRHAQLRRSCSA